MCNVQKKNVEGASIRYIIGKDKRHQLFVSDLIDNFGEGFFKQYGAGLKTSRVAGKLRRLIPGSAVGKLDLVPKKAAKKAKEKPLKVRATIRISAKAKDKPLLGVLKNTDRHVRDFDAVNEQMLRSDFSKICARIAKDLIDARGLTKKAIDDSDRWVYREAHRTIYFEFDRIVGRKLKNAGRELKDYGLGYGSHKGNYIDNIAKAGMLHELLAVARKMINNTDKTGK
jgi:hypothetical protein